MNTTIVGSGYVGLVTGACFAQVGHHVIRVDNNERRSPTPGFGLVKELSTPDYLRWPQPARPRMLVEMGFDYYGIGR